ncbi:hypothetical protein [Spartinivicinus ruber]|uniref:hypothetical protein n=1 Tax=Spartinivicinus ruber TaxID=2683272 RepID=UPI0013D27D54|nr:hypothetical protein [Spartinivicinus ruber]
MEFSKLNITFGIAIGAIIAAVLNIIANHISRRVNENVKKKTCVKILFGELLNVLNHYQFSGIPISLIDGDDRNISEVIKRMEFAKYGDFKAVKNIELYGFLSAVQVRNIHQLSLKIRNTDTLIKSYLSSEFVNNSAATHEEINLVREIGSRMDYVSDTADLLLSYISEQHPEYSSLFQDTKNIEKPNYALYQKPNKQRQHRLAG